MYLRHMTRRKNGKLHIYWSLVRSVRRGRKVHQETVAQLGELDNKGRASAKLLARRMTGGRCEQRELFEDDPTSEVVPVRLDKIRLERSRGFGDVWLGWTLWRALEFDRVFAELLPPEGNEIAKRGHSRDHRSDCTQVCIALVVTREGMPLGYEVFPGNRTDVTTVEEIVETMEKRFGMAGRVWVMDRGMTSADNLAWLKSTKRRYLVGTSRVEMKQWSRQLGEARGWLLGMGRLGSLQRGHVHPENERSGLDPAGTVAHLYPAHRRRGRLPHPEE